MALAYQCNIDSDELGAQNDGININTKWDNRIIRPADNVAVTLTNIPRVTVTGYDNKRREMMEVNEKPPYKSHQYALPSSTEIQKEPQQLIKKKSEAWSVDVRSSKEELKDMNSPQRPKSASYGEQGSNKGMAIRTKQPVSWTVDVGKNEEERGGGKSVPSSTTNRINDKGAISKIPSKSKNEKTIDLDDKSRKRQQSLREFQEDEQRIQSNQQYSPSRSTNNIRTGGIKRDNDTETIISTLSAPTLIPTHKTNLLTSILTNDGNRERPNSAPNTKKVDNNGPRSFASAYTVIDDESIPGSQYSHFTNDSVTHKKKMGDGAAILLPNNVWDGVGSDQGVCVSQTLFQSTQPIRCVNFLSSGQINDYVERSHVVVALGTNAKSVHTLSYNTGYENEPKKEIDFLDIHRGSVYSMDFLSQEKIIATGSNDKSVKLCSMASGTVGPPLKGHNGTIRIVKFNSDSSSIPLLASGGAGDNSPRIWDINKCLCISALEPHQDAVHGLTWLDNDLLLSGCDKGKIIAHDLRSRCAAWSLELPKLINQPIGICTMSLTKPGSNSILIGCTNGLVIGISARDRRLLAAEKLHGDDVRGLCIAPWEDSNLSDHTSSFYFLTTSFDGTACVWRSNGENQSKYPYQRLSILKGHTDKVLGAAIHPSPDNFEMITTGADGKALLWKPKVSTAFL
jgi:WD40 repeat protein